MVYWGVPFPSDVSGFAGFLLPIGFIALFFCFLFLIYSLLSVFLKSKDFPLNTVVLISNNPENKKQAAFSLFQSFSFLFAPSAFFYFAVCFASWGVFFVALALLLASALFKTIGSTRFDIIPLVRFKAFNRVRFKDLLSKTAAKLCENKHCYVKFFHIFFSATLSNFIIIVSVLFVSLFFIERGIISGNYLIISVGLTVIFINSALATPSKVLSEIISSRNKSSRKKVIKRSRRDAIIIFSVLGLIAVTIVPSIGRYAGSIAMRSVGFASVNPVVYTISREAALKNWPKNLIADCYQSGGLRFIFPVNCSFSQVKTKKMTLIFQGGGEKYLKINRGGYSFVYEVPKVGRIALVKRIRLPH